MRFGIPTRIPVASVVLGVILAACTPRAPRITQTEEVAKAPVVPVPAPANHWWQPQATMAPSRPEIWKDFSGEKAFEHTRRLIDLGPRPSGSDVLEQARGYITQQMEKAGWKIERQEFTGDTPHGKIKFVNLIARFGESTSTQQAIVCSHYDTKLFSTIRFVGASDGGSSTGALIELGRVLALDPALAAKIELVFFDGEEAIVQFTAPDDPHPDGLYGSRYYAQQLRETNRFKQYKFGVLWDMIGDSDLTVTLPPDSPPELVRDMLGAAEALNLRSCFSYLERDILDDHVQLNLAHVPTIDLIDFKYPPWHTADDTLDKLSADSLQKVGAVTLFFIRQRMVDR